MKADGDQGLRQFTGGSEKPKSVALQVNVRGNYFPTSLKPREMKLTNQR